MKAASRTRAAGRGFGLVEMMVSLALGLLVVGGATVLLLASRQSNGSNDNLSRVQESVRTSYDLMARELREAGGTPCDSQLLVANVLSNAQGSTPTWWAVWSEPLRGFGASEDFDGADFGTAAGTRVNGTQAVAVRYGAALDGLVVTAHDTSGQQFTVNTNNHGIAAGDLLMVCNYKQAALFQATAANITNGTFVHGTSGGTPGNCSGGLGLPTLCTSGGNAFEFAAGAQVGRYTAAGWYIGNNGRSEGNGRSLYRVSALGPEEVADGVTNMQLSYLLAGAADYVAAAAVTDWSRVMAVRLDLNFEGPELQASTVSGVAPARLARTVGFTINLRNQQP